MVSALRKLLGINKNCSVLMDHSKVHSMVVLEIRLAILTARSAVPILIIVYNAMKDFFH
jgi:hypothetical protein